MKTAAGPSPVQAAVRSAPPPQDIDVIVVVVPRPWRVAEQPLAKVVLVHHCVYSPNSLVAVEEGTVLRVAGDGLPADKPGAPPGDLFVVIRAAEDSRFERRGSDLYRTETIDVVDAVLGVKIDVPLLNGQQTVDVPAGAQPDTILRLVGKGLPRFGGGRPGDLYVRLQVHVPERLSDRQRGLYEQLKATNPPQTKLESRDDRRRNDIGSSARHDVDG